MGHWKINATILIKTLNRIPNEHILLHRPVNITSYRARNTTYSSDCQGFWCFTQYDCVKWLQFVYTRYLFNIYTYLKYYF